MPANLSPEYIRLEGLLREAKTPEEKLPLLREMLRVVPKHKGTEKLQAELKRKISKLQDAEQEGGRRHGPADPFHVTREGAGQAVLAGAPNSGKSALLDVLTHAHPVVADFPFSTVRPLPGMVPFDDIQIQLVDAPPLVRESLPPGIINLYRNADLIVLVVDLADGDPLAAAEAVMAILTEHLVTPVSYQETEVDVGQTARVRKRTLVLGSKYDEPGASERLAGLAEGLSPLEVIPVSCLDEELLAGIPALLFCGLHNVRVYTKKPGYRFERTAPYILPGGSTVLDAAQLIHKDFAEKMKLAKVWGSAKHDGQAVTRDHVLEDKDVIEFYM